MVRHSGVRPPAVLMMNDDEWLSRSLETILVPAGYAVTRAYTAIEGIRSARIRGPDAIIINHQLPDADGTGTLRLLRLAEEIGRRTPLLLSFNERASGPERRAAFGAGAWQLIEPPIEPDQLVLNLQVFVEAKREAEEFRAAAFLDRATGLYSRRGIEQRAQEILAWATRANEALACVAVGPEPEKDEPDAAMRALSQVLRTAGRRSDTIGHLENERFVILAPATDANGAVRLVERLAEAASPHLTGGLRAGYEVVWNPRETAVTAGELVSRAARALDRATTGDGFRAPAGA